MIANVLSHRMIHNVKSIFQITPNIPIFIHINFSLDQCSQSAIFGTATSASMQIENPKFDKLKQNVGGGTQGSELLQALPMTPV